MSLSKGFQPLYKQVYDLLTERLATGYWKPSESLPSEFALADELGVSQGTVRKALNQLVSEKLLRRRQGRGTYVNEHTQESSLFRFFRLREAAGESVVPNTTVISSRRRKAKRLECKHLELDTGEQVVELTRLRFIKDQPAVVENVIQPLSIFPDIDKVDDLPNSLYSLYQESYGISIVSVEDELQAVAMPRKFAKYLELSPDTPVLMVERSSRHIDGRVVEWSQAYCRTEQFVYAVTLS